VNGDPPDDTRLLAAYVAAREAGDVQTAYRRWQSLVVLNLDRVRGFVRLHGRDRLSVEEREDALGNALERLLGGMFKNFRGESMGEWILSAKTAARFACGDVLRHESYHHRRVIAADAPHAGDSDSDSWDAVTYRAALHEHLAAEEEMDEAEELGGMRRAFDRAVAQLSEKRRAVIEFDLQGVPVETIEKELGMSRDAIYQTRRRALQDLERFRKEYWP
jgi:RNA polymerase sigma factor (sigma-70 family)